MKSSCSSSEPAQNQTRTDADVRHRGRHRRSVYAMIPNAAAAAIAVRRRVDGRVDGRAVARRAVASMIDDAPTMIDEPMIDDDTEGIDGCCISLRADDGTIVFLNEDVAHSAGTLHDWLESGVDRSTPFSVPFGGAVLKRTASLLKYHHGFRSAGVRRTLAGALAKNQTSLLGDLFELTSVANFMAADTLFDTLAMAIGLKLTGRSDAQLRDLLQVECDLPEHESVRRESFTVAPTPCAWRTGAFQHLKRRSSGTLSCVVAADDDLNEEVVEAALAHVDFETLCELKRVSRAWRQRAREQLSRPHSAFWSRQSSRDYWTAISREQSERWGGGKPESPASAQRRLRLHRVHGPGGLKVALAEHAMPLTYTPPGVC